MPRLDAVCSSDRLARIEVRAGSGRAVAVGVGSLQVDLPDGLYEVQATARGRLATEVVEVTEAGGPASAEVGLPPYASAAPTFRSTTFDPNHVTLLDGTTASLGPLGTSAGLVVMLRHLDGNPAAPPAALAVELQGEAVPLRWSSVAGASCGAGAVPPGQVLVRSGGSDPSALALPMWAGWHTLLFVPVTGDRLVMDQVAIHCSASGASWADAQGMAELTEQLVIALADGTPHELLAATVGGESPLHHLLRGDAGALSQLDPAGAAAPADYAAIRIRAAGPDDEPVERVENVPVLAGSATTLLRYEARHPWSLDGRFAAACAARLASPVAFRWRPDGEARFQPSGPNEWNAAADRVARRPPSIRRLDRMAADDRLDPAGRIVAAHLADRAYATQRSVGELVRRPVGDIVLTTGLPAVALHGAIGGVALLTRRARLRRIVGGTAVAAIVAAGLAIALWPDDEPPVGDAAAIDQTTTVVTELGTTTTVVTELEPDIATTDEDTEARIEVLANDPDGLTVVAVGEAANGTVGTDGDTVLYLPNPDFNGPDAFSYTASDGSTELDGVVEVEVVPVNDAPVAVDDTATVEAGTSQEIDVLINDTDVDLDTLTISGITDETESVFVVEDRIVVDIPAETQLSFTFTYEIDDGNGGTDTADVAVQVTPAPVVVDAVDDTAQTLENTPTTIVLTENDAGVTDSSFLAIESPPKSGQAIIDGFQANYTPNPGFVGTDTFSYRLTTGASTDVANVTVTVQPDDVIDIG